MATEPEPVLDARGRDKALYEKILREVQERWVEDPDGPPVGPLGRAVSQLTAADAAYIAATSEPPAAAPTINPPAPVPAVETLAARDAAPAVEPVAIEAPPAPAERRKNRLARACARPPGARGYQDFDWDVDDEAVQARRTASRAKRARRLAARRSRPSVRARFDRLEDLVIRLTRKLAAQPSEDRAPLPSATATASVKASPNALISQRDLALACCRSMKHVTRRLSVLPPPALVTGTKRLTRYWLASMLDQLRAIVLGPAPEPARPRSSGGNRGGGRRKAAATKPVRLIDRVRGR